MSHVALYRKYRSQNFDELVGQEHVIRTLKNAIDLGKISQTYLFTGPRGTGKTSTARLLAKALNCTGGPSSTIPADCPICEDITRGNCMDVIEIDAASESGVDDVRDHIVMASEYKPTYCRYKIFIIDEVHDLSPKAFDALLKTIEEPPDHIIFILATTEFHKVPATIKSRCQKFEFHRGSLHDLISRLTYVAEQEQVEVDSAALAAIARMADGGFRDALTLFEQALITSDGHITLEHVYDQLGLIADETADGLILSLVEGEIVKILSQVEAVYRTGRDPSAIVESLLYRLSDLTRSVFDLKDAPETDSTLAAASSSVAQRLGAEKILTLRSHLAETHKALRDVSLPRIWLEAEFVRIAQRLNAPVEKVQSVASEARAAVSAPMASTPKGSNSETQSTAPAKSIQDSTGKSDSSESAQERRTENKPAQVRRIESSHPMAEKWDAIVNKLSEKSPTAKMRLMNSKLVDASDKIVKIEYARIVDAEWVSENKKLQPALIAEWKASTGHDVYFEHVGPGESTGKAIPAPVVEKASVESPLTGEALASEVMKTFDVQQDN